MRQILIWLVAFVSLASLYACQDNHNDEPINEELTGGDWHRTHGMTLYFRDEQGYNLLNDIELDTLQFAYPEVIIIGNNPRSLTYTGPHKRIGICFDQNGERFIDWWIDGEELSHTTMIKSPAIFGDNKEHYIESYWTGKDETWRTAEKIKFDGNDLKFTEQMLTNVSKTYIVEIIVNREK